MNTENKNIHSVFICSLKSADIHSFRSTSLIRTYTHSLFSIYELLSDSRDKNNIIAINWFIKFSGNINCLQILQ